MSPMKTQTFKNVWDALENIPEAAENFKARAEPLLALQEYVNALGVPPNEVARRLSLTLPRLRDLLRGQIDESSLDHRVNLRARAGKRVEFLIRDAA